MRKATRAIAMRATTRRMTRTVRKPPPPKLPVLEAVCPALTESMASGDGGGGGSPGGFGGSGGKGEGGGGDGGGGDGGGGDLGGGGGLGKGFEGMIW